MLNFLNLNEAQRRAVTHPEGPAIVLAGPGSGKTFLIVNRIIYLIEYQKVIPETILVITFTKAAALSMQRRFEKSTEGKYTKVRFGTFHSFFFQILKEYDSYNNNSLFETEEKKLYLKNTFAELGIQWDNSIDYVSFISNPLLYATESRTEEQIRQVIKTLKKQIRRDRKLDFDDMSELVLSLLKKHPQILKELQNRYKYILVDEYQDSNRSQEEILKLLSAPSYQIMVVGDDDQSIYGFRGSEPGIMSGFRRQFPGARMYVLERNYRSTQRIVFAATQVINENRNRFKKDLKSEAETGEKVRCLGFQNKKMELLYIAKRLMELNQKYNISFSDMAVITRTNREQDSLKCFLQKNKIPCIKGKKQRELSEHFVAKELLDCFEFLIGKRDRAPAIWNAIGGDEKKRRILEKQVPIAAIHFICNVMGYIKVLQKQAISVGKREEMDAENLLAEWIKVISIIKEHGKNHLVLKDWVLQLRIYLEEYETKEVTSGVNILTMHGAKGLEFSYVCIPDANEGVIPGKRCKKEEEPEEERRLFYVAMTRAKKILDILYLTGTPDYPRFPSRFLNPLLKSEMILKSDYSSSSTNSSNSTLSKNSSNASATSSYSSSSSIKINSGSTLGSFSSSR